MKRKQELERVWMQLIEESQQPNVFITDNLIQEIPQRCVKVKDQDSLVYEEELDEELLFQDNHSTFNDDGLDSDELESKVMTEEIELLESIKPKKDGALIDTEQQDHSEVNFNLIKNSKAFKSKLRK